MCCGESVTMVTIALAEGRNVATATGGNPPTTDGKFSIFFQLRQNRCELCLHLLPCRFPPWGIGWEQFKKDVQNCDELTAGWVKSFNNLNKGRKNHILFEANTSRRRDDASGPSAAGPRSLIMAARSFCAIPSYFRRNGCHSLLFHLLTYWAGHYRHTWTWRGEARRRPEHAGLSKKARQLGKRLRDFFLPALCWIGARYSGKNFSQPQAIIYLDCFRWKVLKTNLKIILYIYIFMEIY